MVGCVLSQGFISTFMGHSLALVSLSKGREGVKKQ